MAGWQDGAEYAPIERPDGFATPIADPLPDPEPVLASTPGPGAPPTDFHPAQAFMPSLDKLDAAPQVQRNPREPFSTTSALMTGDSAWGAAHRSDLMLPGAAFDPHQPIRTSADSFAPPTGDPLSFPPPSSSPVNLPPPTSSAVNVAPMAGQEPNPYAPPGAAPDRQPSAAAGPLTTAQSQMSTTAIMVLVLGVIVTSLAPFALLISGGLTMRVERLRAPAFTLIGFGSLFLLRMLNTDITYDTWGGVYRLACIGGIIWLTLALSRANRR